MATRPAKCWGRNIAVVIPADQPGELSYLLDRVRAGEIVRNFHTKWLRKNGTMVEVAITVSPVVGSDGEILGGSTIAHDLTLYNQRIVDLREAHRRADEAVSTLETLQASAPIGFGFVDTEFRLTHLNEMLASFSGSTTKELLGKTVAEVVPEIWSQVEPIYRRVVESGEPSATSRSPGRLPASRVAVTTGWRATTQCVLRPRSSASESSWSMSQSGVKLKSSGRSP